MQLNNGGLFGASPNDNTKCQISNSLQYKNKIIIVWALSRQPDIFFRLLNVQRVFYTFPTQLSKLFICWILIAQEDDVFILRHNRTIL